MGILDVPGLTRSVADQLYSSKAVAQLITGRFPAPSERKLIGPLASGIDMPVITTSAAADASYNKSWTIVGTTYPAGWPVDVGESNVTFSSNYSWSNPTQQVRLWRFMMDGWKVALKTGNLAPGDSFYMWVNGAPVSFEPTAFGPTNSLTTIVFGDDAAEAKPRLIEILTTAGIGAVYTHNPYRLWKPPPARGPKVLLMGDSYSAGVTIDTAYPTATESSRMYGFATQLGLHLGVDRWMTDGIGGSGFVKNGGGYGNYRTRLSNWLSHDIDMFIAAGGGANDLLAGFATVSQIVDAAIILYTDARAAWPEAKLVFVEGFAPPNGYSTFNDEYISIRQQLQVALADVGVYYVDVATTSAWIDGSGFKGSPSGSGNSDIYIGGDGAHPTIPGARYIRERLAPPLRAILADDGERVNELIAA